MTRTLAIVLQLAIAIVVSLALLTLWQWLIEDFGDGLGEAFVQAARLLFLFMDVGLVVWLALLIVGAVRRRGIGWGIRGSIGAAFLAALTNLVVVIVVGFVQGGWAMLFVLFAVAGGLAFVIGAVIAALAIAPRVKPSGPAVRPT
jgi:hypothetical protein